MSKSKSISEYFLDLSHLRLAGASAAGLLASTSGFAPAVSKQADESLPWGVDITKRYSVELNCV